MCGIAGYLTRDRARLAPDHRVLERMTAAILHRGPDSDGGWRDEEKGVALGMRRLAIIDLSSAGWQPMHSADGRYVIVFNGEIYNHRALRSDLEAQQKGGAWRGHSDTEVLLAAISGWGLLLALNACNGMFAFALWDRREEQLHLAVDRFGEKPLYFGWLGNDFVFGSELKALTCYPGFAASVDQDALALLLRFGYVPAPYSIYRGVQKLAAGTTASLSWPSTDQTKLQHKVYWSARDTVSEARASPLIIREADANEQFESLLADCVKLRMEADVPLGAFLSGGFDSTAVVALMQRHSSRPVRTFTIGFTEQAYNEAPFAKRVAEHLGTDHTELYVTPEQTMNVIPRLPAMYDEPFADSSQIPTFLVAQLARQHVTVSLSGDGGDEMFGGYTRYFISNRYLRPLSHLPMPIRRMMASSIEAVGVNGWDALYRMLRLGKGTGKVGDRALKFAAMLTFPSLLEGYRSIVSQCQDPCTLLPIDKEPSTALDAPGALPSHLSFVEQMIFLDLITYLPGDILTKVDRATMAVSLEGRIPYLDPRLLTLMWRLPLDYRVRGGTGKRILRNLVYRHVPQSIMDRPKMGFGIPIGEWLRGPLKPWAESLLCVHKLEDAGFRPAPVLLAWQEHKDGSRHWHYLLWPVLMFMAWQQSRTAASALTPLTDSSLV